ncbi:MAG TPA: hypothetical protein VGO27_21170, partial [Candidatus Acidoferrum sp.]|nr:hypothetical protein [Candidatus Acidoferrum sp.]
HLQISGHVERVEASSTHLEGQLDSSALGRLIEEKEITGLPLSTRNFAQIVGLSAGVTTGVYNAGELGRGDTDLSQLGKSNDGIYVHGARSYDNNWQLDGISVSDVQSTGSTSGGIAVPNPDTLKEFKVQTGLYDAAFGRSTGANISVVTKTGGDEIHGDFFEFVRNDVLNANDFFLNETGQRRPNLKQNQFGLSVGGPVKRDELFAFGSYQGTRQVNGLAAGQARVACTASLSSPALTDDRSPAALGLLFGGMKGALGGVAVKPDGSNINPAALALLNFRLPDGSFLIPTAQTQNPSKPFASRGFSAFSEPCDFAENQFLINSDYLISNKSRIAMRFFLADSNQTVTFPGGGLNASGNIGGFTSLGESNFVVISLSHTYTLSSALLNEARFGFVRTRTATGASAPLKWSDVGVTEGEMNLANELPSLNILGSVSMTPAFPRAYTQNSFVFNDMLSIIHGAHAAKFGGSLTRVQDNLSILGAGSFLQFLSWPDFLLGLNAKENGTGNFSNVFASADLYGLLDREYRAWEGAAFANDSLRINRSLTINTGVRYEYIGQFGDNLGRSSSFDVNLAAVNPLPAGSVRGYIVGSNFPSSVPTGVIRAGNTSANYGVGPNTLAPRMGFAWQILPRNDRLVLKGGYGIFYSRPPGQAFVQSVVGAPFGMLRSSSGLANANATFANPFPQPFPTASSFPLFPAYSPSTNATVRALSPNFRPAMVQQFSLNVEGELYAGWLLETAFVGARGTHLQRLRSLNQALDATTNAPVRGEYSDTLANISLRVPIPGINADSLRQLESEGDSWYNALEASLTKRFDDGLQLLASYTFSKTMDTDGADIDAISSGNALTVGDQNSPGQRWGRASFDRTHRFVFSAIWTLPGPSHGMQRAIFNGWSLAALTIIQSGSALTVQDTNSTNVFGITSDRAQLSGACTKSQFVGAGSIGSKLNNYFNKACFSAPPVIGADGVGTAFGNSGTGIVDGPGQANLDLALSKLVRLDWPRENCNIEFRAEFFNAFNHPQFSNPDSNFTSPTFGAISSTSVNARIGQFALKFAF